MAIGCVGGLLDLEDVSVKALEHVLALVDLRWGFGDMVTGEREISAGLVHLERTFAVVGSRQRSFHEDMQAGPRGRDFGVAIEGCDYFPGPRCNLTSFSVAALVDVYPSVGVILCKDESDAIVALGYGYGRIERRPRLRVGAASASAVDRVRDFRKNVAAGLFAPADELVGRSQFSWGLVY